MSRVFERFSGRKLTVDGVLWKWKTGKSGRIIAMNELGERFLSFSNWTPNKDFERGQHKKTSEGMITPKDVTEWISKLKVK